MDVDPGTLNLDWELVRKRIVSDRPAKLQAILPVHLYGQCADMDAFTEIGQEFGLAIVEDAAQAIGAQWRGRGAGCAGSDGCVQLLSDEESERLWRRGNRYDHGFGHDRAHAAAAQSWESARRYYHDEFGWNGRMDAIQAAVLRVKLGHLAEWNRRRQAHAAVYDRLLVEAGLISSSSSTVSPVRLVARAAEAKHVFHQYVIRAKRRDELRAFLAERKIRSEVYYPLPLHLQSVFSYLGMKEGDLPVAEQAAKDVLALPMFAELTEAELHSVVAGIADFYS